MKTYGLQPRNYSGKEFSLKYILDKQKIIKYRS